MSFKPAFQVGSDPKFYVNAQAFATKQEAEDSAIARYRAWTMCAGYEVQESTAPVNYARTEHGDVMLPSLSAHDPKPVQV